MSSEDFENAMFLDALTKITEMREEYNKRKLEGTEGLLYLEFQLKNIENLLFKESGRARMSKIRNIIEEVRRKLK